MNGEMRECTDCGKASKPIVLGIRKTILGADLLRVRCPQCRAVDEIPQGGQA